MNIRIRNIKAREVIDSRGTPTVEVEIELETGIKGRFIVPSGASTGSYEALELRDNDKRYFGKGVSKAIANVHEIIAPHILSNQPDSQTSLDQSLIELDGTANKGKLGANAILGVSIAYTHACSRHYNMPLYQYIGGIGARTLPVPMFNILNGGAHADNNVDFQEFMIVPFAAHTFKESLRMGVEVFQTLKNILHKNKYNTAVGDEGGFAPNLKSNEHALDFIIQAIEEAGYRPKKDIAIALDVAANEIFHEKHYILNKGNTHQKMTSEQFVQYYCDLCDTYPISSIEDPLHEDDWATWTQLTEKIGKKIQLVGDDIFVTHATKLKEAIEKKAANSILIKFNQVGTLTETLQTIEIAKRKGYSFIISHRSGETEDSTIADLAVATNSPFIKAGSLSRTDRLAKYNQLIRIEEQLGNEAIFAGQHLKL